MIDYEYVKCLGDIFLDVGLSEKERTYRFQALQNTYGKANAFLKKGFLPELVEAFFVRKVQKLSEVHTKKDMELFIAISKPQHMGRKLEPDGNPFYSEEEELLAWSLTSLQAPLASIGLERYFELLKKLLPEKAAQIEGRMK